MCQIVVAIYCFQHSIICSVGFILTYFTIQSYFALAVLSLSLHGLGFSFVYGTAIAAAQSWFPRHRRGLVGSIVLSGYGVGSLIWIPAQTSWVNPDNVGAEWDPGCDNVSNMTTDINITTMDCDNRYYRDPAMLARVPGMFLMLGLVYGACGLAATLLITDAGPDHCDHTGGAGGASDGQEGSMRPRQVLRTAMFYQVWSSGTSRKCRLILILSDLAGLLQLWLLQRPDVDLQQDIRADIHQ